AEAARGAKVDRSKYQIVRTLQELATFIGRAADTGTVAIEVQASGSDPMQAQLVGVALALDAADACYIPLTHRRDGAFAGDGRPDEELDFDGRLAADLLPDQIPLHTALELLKPLLEDPSVLKIAHGLKFVWLLFCQHGIEVASADDVELMSYALDAGKS